MKQSKQQQTGVSLIEFSLVAIAVITLSLGILDVTRFFAVRYLAYQGALVALDQATKAPYLNLNESGLSGATLTNYKTVLTEAMSSVSKISGRLIRPSTATSGTRFVRYPVSINGSANIQMDAILLRPGDCYTASDGDVADHPSASCHDSLPSSFEDALRTHPFVVQARVNFAPLTPLLKNFKFNVRAVGWRELFIRGGGAAEVDVPLAVPPDPPDPDPPGGGNNGGGNGNGNGGGPPPAPTPPPCTRKCGANQLLVGSSCTCYCGIGYCPRGEPNPGSCSPGCGG